MKFSKVFKTNAINMIIGEGDYSITKLRKYLLKSFYIVDYDGFNLSSLNITRGEEDEKPSLMIIDMRDMSSDFVSVVTNLVYDYAKNKYDITLLLICSCVKSHNEILADDLHIDCGNSIAYLSQCILRFVDENSYEVIKSLDCELHKIVNLTQFSSTHFYKDLLGIKTQEFSPNPKHRSNEKGINDCFIRSMCKLLDKSWNDVYSEIVHIGFEEKEMYNSVKLNRKYLKRFGFILREFKYRAATIGQFMYEHRTGSFLIGDKFHVVAYIDGVVYDNQICLRNFDNYLTSYAAYVFTNQDLNDEYFHEPDEDDISIPQQITFADRGSLYQSVDNPNIYYLIASAFTDNRVAAILHPIDIVRADDRTICIDCDDPSSAYNALHHPEGMFANIGVEYIKSNCLGITKVTESALDKLGI